jgi:hypothetical protein
MIFLYIYIYIILIVLDEINMKKGIKKIIYSKEKKKTMYYICISLGFMHILTLKLFGNG